MSLEDDPVVAGLPSDPHLVVPIVEITRRIGTRRPFAVSTTLPLPAVAGIEVPPGQPIVGELLIESVLDGIVVAGTLRAPWEGLCRRCLEPVGGIVDVDVQELFEAHATPGDTYPIDGDHIDLTPLVWENVLLALPLSPVCSDDCAGPDPERFPTVIEADEPPPSTADPRWAALGDLRFDDAD